MNGESIVQGILIAFAIGVVLMPAFIRMLRRIGMGKRIRLEGPETHYVKEGTPTMGGLLIVGVVLGVGLDHRTHPRRLHRQLHLRADGHARAGGHPRHRGRLAQRAHR